MELWEAIVLGVVEGLTEYLPVSSTGHLLITQELLGIGTESEAAREAANAFAICIQAGAILAVLGLYWRRVVQVGRGLGQSVGLTAATDEGRRGLRLGSNIVVAFIPAAVIGVLFDEKIEALLFGPWPIVAAWFVGGVAILAVVWWQGRSGKGTRGEGPGGGGEAGAEAGVDGEHRGRSLDELTLTMALVIGLIQCLAMWPGTSRSLVTIVGGVLVGLRLAAAVEFSFLLGVLTLCAATVYKAGADSVLKWLVKGEGFDENPIMLFQMAHEYGWPALIVGSLAAWVSAVVAVRWMVEYLKRHGMSVFGYYRIGIAVVTAGLILGGVITAG